MDYKSQNKYISEHIAKLKNCDFIAETQIDAETIVYSAMKNIIDNRYTNAFDMKAVFCLFQNLIYSAERGKINGIYMLSQKIKNWVSYLSTLSQGTQGIAYMADILGDDIKIVMKVPKTNEEYNTILKEYFIGLTAINNLRYIVPNFTYTFGSFLCPIPSSVEPYVKLCDKEGITPFIMSEYISGMNLRSAIRNNFLTFESFLHIFLQIILALEVSQEKCEFTHYDLHDENVILRRSGTYFYNVPIGEQVYNVQTDLIPTIIDFGFSSIKSENYNIGTYGYDKYGIKNYMVQGFDMYKFLIYCADSFSKTEIGNKDIIELFYFYGGNDPYNIVELKDIGIKNALISYCKLCTYSNVAKYIPLDFINWIYNNPKYNFVKKNLNIIPRNIVVQVNFSSPEEEYKKLFKKFTEDETVNIKTILEKYKQMHSSYIIDTYNTYLISKYEKYITKEVSEILYSEVNPLLIKSDIEMLLKYRDIKIPSETQLITSCDNVLKLNVYEGAVPVYELPERRKYLKDLDDNMKFYISLIPYLQFLYTIKELKENMVSIPNDYLLFITEFEASKIYTLYKKQFSKIRAAVRWSETIKASMPQKKEIEVIENIIEEDEEEEE
jgi:serine/threonine protein kinase